MHIFQSLLITRTPQHLWFIRLHIWIIWKDGCNHPPRSERVAYQTLLWWLLFILTHEKNTMGDKKKQIFSCKCGVIHRALCFWLASNKHCSRSVLFKQSLNGVQPRTLRLLSLARNQKVVSRQQKPCVELCTHQLADQKILQLWFQTTYIICAHNKCQTPSTGSFFGSRLVPASLC